MQKKQVKVKTIKNHSNRNLYIDRYIYIDRYVFSLICPWKFWNPYTAPMSYTLSSANDFVHQPSHVPWGSLWEAISTTWWKGWSSSRCLALLGTRESSGVIFKCHDAMPLCTMHQILAHLEMPNFETRFQRIFRQMNIVAMENGWFVGDVPSYKPPFIYYRFIDVDRCRSIQMDVNRWMIDIAAIAHRDRICSRLIRWR